MPRLLIVDDVFGRTVKSGVNEERLALCGRFLLEDATGDESARFARQTIREPVAEAIFHRGQVPAAAVIGDTVRNDLDGVIKTVQEGWTISATGSPCWSLVLLDLCFYTGRVTEESDRRCLGAPKGRTGDDDPTSYFGLEILAALHRRFPDLPVVILSSKPRDSVSFEFSRLGALGFIDRSSPESPLILRDYLSRHGLIQDQSGVIAGQAKPLLFALRAARRVAVTRRNILILGERGTGKELLASYIHAHSYGGNKPPLVPVDSGTLDAHLYASALFGHRKGAFTGAGRDRKGYIVEASGGDLFLDEIGNMPAEVQSGLLRVLEERRVVPLGEVSGIPVDTRFLSATNEDIETRAASGAFRPDLLDRLRQGGAIEVLALRKRMEDLPVLVERFTREAEAVVPGAVQRLIDPRVIHRLSEWHWPGNVRELRDCILSAVSNHPHVEFMVAGHLHIPEARESPQQPLVASAGIPEPNEDPLEQLARLMDAIDFSSIGRPALVGRFARLNRAFARLMARYLKAVVEATRRVSPGNPEGDVLVHPAMRLMTGDPELTAAQASDLIKRLVRLDAVVLDEVVNDPLLAQARERAQKLRPSTGRSAREPA